MIWDILYAVSLFWFGVMVGGGAMAMMAVSGNESRREEERNPWELPPEKTDRRNIWDPEA